MKTYIVDISFEVETDETEGELLSRIYKEHPNLRELNIQESKFDSYLYPRLTAIERR